MYNQKNFLVTGCTSGIGLETTKQLLRAGSNVMGVGRDAAKIGDVIKEYESSFTFLSLDLSAPAIQIQEPVNEFAARYGKFHGMVYCAGKEETLPISMYGPEKLSEIFNVNFNSAFECLRTVSKKKISEDGASFVFLSSVMGELGQPGKTAYCASKAAVIGLVKSAAIELAARKIRVNAISPGIVETPMTEKLFNLITPENKQKIVEMHPLGTGNTEDVAALLLFLLSDQSKWITGQNYKIDGGYSIQ